MKLISLFSVLLFSFGIVHGQDGKLSINDFSGMAGCWERTDRTKSLLVSEQWMKPAGTSILGMGRTVRNGTTVDYEFMRIEQRTDGVYFIVKPKANAEETAFKMKTFQKNRVEFENLEHDFPQRVIYTFNKPNILSGRIEGTMNGKLKGIDFPMTRAKCN